MPLKKSSIQKSEPITKEFLSEFVTQQIDKVIGFVKQQRTLLESQIAFSRKDAKEQIWGAVDGLNKRIDNLDDRFTQRIGVLDKKIEMVDLKIEAVHDNVKAVQTDVKEIKQKLNEVSEKVEKHDEEIAFLKSAVS